MVAHEGGDFSLCKELDAFVRVRVVPHQVAQADDLVDSEAIDLRENDLEGLEIRMNV
jgi:hypothetical protein